MMRSHPRAVDCHGEVDLHGRPPTALFAVLVLSMLVIDPAPGRANSGTTPTPVPTPSSTPLPDPCGSLISLVTRPSVTTSPCTLHGNHAIVETGYTNVITTGSGSGHAVSYPQPFVHVGTRNPHLELDMLLPSWNRVLSGGAVASGASDVGVGLKYELGYDSKAIWGTNAQVTFPTGDRAFTGGQSQYTWNFDWTYALSPTYGFAGTMSYSSLAGFDSSGEVQRFSNFTPTLILSASLPPSSSAFAEYAYFTHAGLGLGAKSLIDFGYVRDVSPNTQIDLEYGFSPTEVNGSRQHYAGLGVSFMR